MEARAGQTHHAVAYCSKSGATWEVSLTKNGEVSSVPVSVVEHPTNYYNFSFVNDGTDRSTWDLTAREPTTGTVASESWFVTASVVEALLAELLSNQHVFAPERQPPGAYQPKTVRGK